MHLPPSVRGRGFAAAAQELHALLETGRLDAEAVEARLPAADLELLEHKPDPDAWVPIESYARVLDLLAETSEAAPVDFHRRRGLESAERLIDAGVHEADGDEAARDEAWHAPLERLVMGAEGDLYSFPRWSFEPSATPGCFVLRIEEAEALPDAAQHALEGLVAYAVAYLLDQPIRVASRRPTPDHLVVEGRTPRLRRRG
jgi:hypothetical protein